MFGATELNLQNDKSQQRYRRLFLAMTLLLILPVLIILILLIIRGGPIFSMEFLFEFPKKGMTAGGIFPALARYHLPGNGSPCRFCAPRGGRGHLLE